MLRWRLLFGVTISVCVVGLCVLDVFLENRVGIPGLALLPLLLVLLVLACREMLLLANRNRVYPVPYITYMGCIIVGLSGWGTFVLQHPVSLQDSVATSEAMLTEVLSLEALPAELPPEASESPASDVSAVPASSSSQGTVPASSEGTVPAVSGTPAASESPEPSSEGTAPADTDAPEENSTVEASKTSSSETGSIAEAKPHVPSKDTKAMALLLKQLEHLTPGNWILSAFAFTLVLVFLQEMYSFVRPGAVNVRMAYTVFTIVYAGVLLAFLTLIRLCFGLSDLIAFIAIIKMGDVGAYTIGRIFGRNKMAPGLSPGKTIEGAVGAILFACITAWLCYAVILPAVAGVKTVPIPFNPVWVVYGAMLGFLGMLGDLAESLMKRDAEVKDASDIVPGFGGVLDLLDSLLLSAPVAYAFLTLNLVNA